MNLITTASIIAPTSSQSSTIVHAFSGASASIIATTLTHPFDVVKVRCHSPASFSFLTPLAIPIPDENASPPGKSLSQIQHYCKGNMASEFPFFKKPQLPKK